MAVLLGVLVAAVLIADRLVDRDELLRRLYQVGLGLSLGSFVIALGSAVIPVEIGDGFDLSLSDAGSAEAVGAVRDRVIFVTVGGLTLLVAGLVASRQSTTLYLGAVVSGILLLAPPLTGNASSASAIYLLYEAALTGDTARNWIYAGALGLGALALTYYGYREYEADVDDAGADDSSGRR